MRAGGEGRHSRKPRSVWLRLVALWTTIRERYTVGVFVTIAFLLLVVGKADLKFVGFLENRGADIAAAALSVMRQPLDLLRDAADGFGEVLAVHAENERLRAENARISALEAELVRLMVQNDALRDILKMPEPVLARIWTTARVVGDSGGAFVDTLLIDAGADRGVEPGMAALNENGLVGRVVGVGARSARILMITDFNSKIPVVLQGSRDQAILEGTDKGDPVLRFLPLDPSFEPGEKVLTSGRSGVFPPGLLVGEVTGTIGDDRGVTVRPFVDWARLDFVTLLQAPSITPPDPLQQAPDLPLAHRLPLPLPAAPAAGGAVEPRVARSDLPVSAGGPAIHERRGDDDPRARPAAPRTGPVVEGGQ